MELEFFIRPDEVIEALYGSVARPEAGGHPGRPQANWGWQMWHKYWVEERLAFYEAIGLPRASLVEYWQKPEELAHYARACVDRNSKAWRPAEILICRSTSVFPARR